MRDPRAQAEGWEAGPRQGIDRQQRPASASTSRMPSQLGPSSPPTHSQKEAPRLGAACPQAPSVQGPVFPPALRSHTHTHPSPGTCSPPTAPQVARVTQNCPGPALPSCPLTTAPVCWLTHGRHAFLLWAHPAPPRPEPELPQRGPAREETEEGLQEPTPWEGRGADSGTVPVPGRQSCPACPPEGRSQRQRLRGGC